MINITKEGIGSLFCEVTVGKNVSKISINKGLIHAQLHATKILKRQL